MHDALLSQTHALVGELLRAYWKPVYFYLRHRGFDNEAAKDLTQDFFQEIVLGRNLIQSADRTRGLSRPQVLALLRIIGDAIQHAHWKRWDICPDA